jgi:hypothetical protein
MSVFKPNEAQQLRDACELRYFCSACGHRETGRNPLVLAASGYRVHLAHITTEVGGGYYGMAYASDLPLKEAS